MKDFVLKDVQDFPDDFPGDYIELSETTVDLSLRWEDDPLPPYPLVVEFGDVTYRGTVTAEVVNDDGSWTLTLSDVHKE